MKLLDQKVTLITGAALGIGAGIADLFAENGAILYLFDLDGEKCQAKAAELRSAGHQAQAFQGDVSRAESLQTCVDAALAAHGRIDAVINNAGIYPRRAFLDMTEAEWDQMQDVNLKSLFHISKLVLPSMIERRSGKIVNISSVTFFKGMALLTHYVASKGGMIGFSRALAREMGPHNIHINCVTPGAIKTEGEVVHADPAAIAAIQARQCLDRRLVPLDVAGPCLFLASSLSDGMTGQTLNVDGGLIMY
ncbi:MAG: SDR family oxidoreductase [Acidobacteria bacterium]|nr:SDR family oxidoreductase [Acidobacteriota bacterium]